MDNEIFIDALAITMMAVGLGMFALGIRVSSGKPFLLRSCIYQAMAVLIFLAPMAASFAGVWPPDWQSVLIASLALALVVPVLVLGLHRSMGDIVVYNATETMIREVLVETLNERNLAHSEGDRPALLSRIFAELYAQTKFSLALKDLNSSIRVTINPLGSATLRFTKKRGIPNYKEFIASLDRKLQTREFEGSRFTRYFMLFMSAGMVGLSIWWLFA